MAPQSSYQGCHRYATIRAVLCWRQFRRFDQDATGQSEPEHRIDGEAGLRTQNLCYVQYFCGNIAQRDRIAHDSLARIALVSLRSNIFCAAVCASTYPPIALRTGAIPGGTNK